MNSQIELWLLKAKLAVETNTKSKWPNTPFNWETLTWIIGTKYYRVMHGPITQNKFRSAFCFIDIEFGNIYKPHNFQRPAKGIRGTIETVDASTLDGTTGWLYR